MSELAPTSQEQSLHYELLVGHARTNGSLKSDEQLRSEYIRRTDELIHTMTSGFVVVDRATGERSIKKPDYVVWLDKSARPVAWLTQELWPKLAAEHGKPTPEMPQFRFVNIDKEQWINTIGSSARGYVNVDAVDKSVIRSLRSIFVAPLYKKDGLGPEIDSAPSELDGKVVLIVDEVFSSGETIEIANKFFRRAFPNTTFETAYWMGGVVQKGTATGNADLPVWYNSRSEYGRGVGNRDFGRSSRSESITQRLGAYFLSTRMPEEDPLSMKLRREIKQLAHDPSVLIQPSFQRDDFLEKGSELNNMTPDQFYDALKRLRETGSHLK